jgi:hypothetical protein
MSYKIYDLYYSASDVNIYLYYPVTDKSVHLDKAMGVSFTHNMSSAPVYTLGNVEPTFFSRGNSLIQGNLDLAFKSTVYLQKTINHLLNTTGKDARIKALNVKATSGSVKGLTENEVKELYNLQTSSVPSMTANSISDIFGLFEIHIEFDNTNATQDGTYHKIKLEGIKFIGQMMSVHSGQEAALVDRYTFLGKNKS